MLTGDFSRAWYAGGNAHSNVALCADQFSTPTEQ